MLCKWTRKNFIWKKNENKNVFKNKMYTFWPKHTLFGCTFWFYVFFSFP